MNAKSTLTIATLLATSFALTGCSEDRLSEDVTDSYVKQLLTDAENTGDLNQKYHIMKGHDGTHLGVLFIQAVKNESGETCANYRAYTSTRIKRPSAQAKETERRKTCVSLQLK